MKKNNVKEIRYMGKIIKETGKPILFFLDEVYMVNTSLCIDCSTDNDLFSVEKAVYMSIRCRNPESEEEATQCNNLAELYRNTVSSILQTEVIMVACTKISEGA